MGKYRWVPCLVEWKWDFWEWNLWQAKINFYWFWVTLLEIKIPYYTLKNDFRKYYAGQKEWHLTRRQLVVTLFGRLCIVYFCYMMTYYSKSGRFFWPTLNFQLSLDEDAEQVFCALKSFAKNILFICLTFSKKVCASEYVYLIKALVLWKYTACAHFILKFTCFKRNFSINM